MFNTQVDQRNGNGKLHEAFETSEDGHAAPSTFNDTYLQIASFVVGALAFDGVLDFTPSEVTSADDFCRAVKVVAGSLRAIMPVTPDMPLKLPYPLP